LKTGPLALLPLWANYSSIVWSIDPDNCKMLQECEEEEFLERLNHAFQSSSDAPAIGRWTEKLPPTIKNRAFEHPPLVD